MYDAAHPFLSTFRDYALDVHVPNILIGIGASIEVPLVTIIGRRILQTKSQIANYVLLSSVCRSCLDIPFSILIEYTGVRNLMLASLLVNVAAAIVGKCIDDAALLTLYCVLSGVSLGGFFLSRHIFVASVSSKRHRGIVMAFLSGLLRWSHVVGPAVAGVIATRTGQVQDAFVVAAATSLLAFFAILAAPLLRRALLARGEHDATPGVCYCVAVANDKDESNDSDNDSDDRNTHVAVVTPPPMRSRALQPPSRMQSHTLSSSSAAVSPAAQSTDRTRPRRSSDDDDVVAPSSTVTATPSSSHRHVDGAVAAPATTSTAPLLAAAATATNSTAYTLAPHTPVTATTPTTTRQHTASSSRHEQQREQHQRPSMRSLTPPVRHDVTVRALWCTVLDSWPVLWRFGLYVVFFGAVRANRKLMLVFAGMQVHMPDAQLSYVLSFGFIFDALLFPLGGVMMDVLGRQYAMMPVALGLAATFVWLPFCTTVARVYVASAMFGIADSLGCGVVMTLTADRAPVMHGGPFFGIIRTLEDFGHVVGAALVSVLLRSVGFRYCSWLLTVVGVCTALWGVYGVPRDTTPLETPRLDKALAHNNNNDDNNSSHAETGDRAVMSKTRVLQANGRAYGTL